jgi:hypothetical protein
VVVDWIEATEEKMTKVTKMWRPRGIVLIVALDWTTRGPTARYADDTSARTTVFGATPGGRFRVWKADQEN